VRLDQRVRADHPDLSWTRVRRAIERGQVAVNGVLERDPAREVTADASIDFDPARPAVRSARLDLPRLYEDREVLVVDKPAGLLTIASSPAGRASEDTILRRVQTYIRHLHGPRGYAGVLHRLDRGTSGALALALSREAHAAGRELFAAHKFDRWYLAIVKGVPVRKRGTIKALISDTYVSGRRKVVRRADQGREAVTHYVVREALRDAALLELRLETGRQHQIRLHLEQLGHPIVGDRVYVGRAAPTTGRLPTSLTRLTSPTRPMLHAWRLEFPHPLHHQLISTEAPIPPDFEELLRRLRL